MALKFTTWRASNAPLAHSYGMQETFCATRESPSPLPFEPSSISCDHM